MESQGIDPATGFPKLPEGYYYRVSKWNPAYGGYEYHVAIRKRVLGIFFREVAWDLVGTASGIPEGARRARADLIIDGHDKSVLGNYPPKKWGAK